eukprot:5007744-Pyramimonas_sp.AAC.1
MERTVMERTPMPTCEDTRNPLLFDISMCLSFTGEFVVGLCTFQIEGTMYEAPSPKSICFRATSALVFPSAVETTRPSASNFGRLGLTSSSSSSALTRCADSNHAVEKAALPNTPAGIQCENYKQQSCPT